MHNFLCPLFSDDVFTHCHSNEITAIQINHSNQFRWTKTICTINVILKYSYIFLVPEAFSRGYTSQ